mmetsp:Transcript_17564/g.40853  ORF Transcript_17564/g.40853 Transcript_17564/m.40853 type:complete len:222 (+) Transcript_17564:117-782(+)
MAPAAHRFIYLLVPALLLTCGVGERLSGLEDSEIAAAIDTAAASDALSDSSTLGEESVISSDIKAYIAIQLKDTSTGKSYHLQAPEDNHCARLKCTAGGEQCSFRQELKPILGGLVTQYYSKDRGAENLQEFKEVLIDHVKGMKLFKSGKTAEKHLQSSYTDDLRGPFSVEPTRFTEAWKYFYVWRIEIDGSVADTYMLDKCKLKTAEGKFPFNGHFKKVQ